MTIKNVIIGARKNNLQINKIIIHSRFLERYLYISKETLVIPKYFLNQEIYSYFYDKANRTYIIRI